MINQPEPTDPVGTVLNGEVLPPSLSVETPAGLTLAKGTRGRLEIFNPADIAFFSAPVMEGERAAAPGSDRQPLALCHKDQI